jgi:RecA-family ATPase
MKTTTSLGIALAVAGGAPYFGGLAVERHGPVLYLLEEGVARQTQNHLRALAAGLGVAVPGNLYISFLPSVQLADPTWRARLVATLRERRPCLIVYDNLTYQVSGDENAKEDVAKARDTIQHLQRVAVNEGLSTAHLLLAHISKGARKTDRADGQIRGSSVWENVYDSHIALRHWRDIPAQGAREVNLDVSHRGYAPLQNCVIIWNIDCNSDEDWVKAICTIKERTK